jgi:hypothetical protein
MVTPETQDLVRLSRHERTWVHMKVRRVVVGRVWDCVLCTCVNEEDCDGEGTDSEASSLLSYTLRHLSFLSWSQCTSSGYENRYTCVHVWTRRVVTGRVRTQKRHLYCHTHFDTSVSRSWSCWSQCTSSGCENQCTCVHAWTRRMGTGRVWTQKRHLWCHTHLDKLDTSVSRSWSQCVSSGCENPWDSHRVGHSVPVSAPSHT